MRRTRTPGTGSKNPVFPQLWERQDWGDEPNSEFLCLDSLSLSSLVLHKFLFSLTPFPPLLEPFIQIVTSTAFFMQPSWWHTDNTEMEGLQCVLQISKRMLSFLIGMMNVSSGLH